MSQEGNFPETGSKAGLKDRDGIEEQAQTGVDLENSSSDLNLPRIRKLDPTVVKRIAAGEIIIQPANALKELLENSIDAGSTMIDVLVKDGGLKLLQLTDNGCGIAKEDMPLLCERFTTSKLRTFDDLSLILTYGFRGEALASISHISRLSVVSKVDKSPLAYKCFFMNGQMANLKFKTDPTITPQPVAGNKGTLISAEDLFYNLPSRLHALRSKNDEWIKILDVLGRYAVHSEGVGFSCKKFGDPHPSISTRPQATLRERIRTVFGTSVASELIEFSFDCEDFGLKNVRGAVSGFNYSNKRKVQPVFFINNRLVACDPLKRAINSVFHVFLPKGNHPFVYLSLEIAPQNVDVNVHPTKREVRFLFEDEISEWVCDKIHDILSERDNSRLFKQSLLKRTGELAIVDSMTATLKKSRQENKMVRVDGNQQKISAFIKPEVRNVSEPPQREVSELLWNVKSPDSTFMEDIIETSHGPETSCHGIETSSNDPDTSNSLESSSTVLTRTGKEHQNIELDSIVELRCEVANSIHRPLSNVFNQLIYVGIVDMEKRLCCFQYDVKLFLCDYASVLTEFFYQRVLVSFANFGEYVLREPIPLRTILKPLYDEHADLQPMEVVLEKLSSMNDMFNEYFLLDFSNDQLQMLPMILKDLEPSRSKLSYFIYRLGTKVDYNDEKACLSGIARQIALLYVPDRIETGESEEKKQLATQKRDDLNSLLEHIVFPAMKKLFIVPEKLVSDVVQVADLPGLYRVFERC